MLKRRTAWAIPFALLIAWQSSLPCTAATPRTVTLEATLLAFGPHLLEKCGQNYVHQVARYRVERVVDGEYTGKEIVVDHPACGGNVFRRIPIGSRVKLTVRALEEYNVIAMYPGVREDGHPKVFYVASAAPEKIRAMSRRRQLTTACSGLAPQRCLYCQWRGRSPLMPGVMPLLLA